MEEFDFEQLSAEIDAEKIEVDEITKAIRDSYATVTRVAGGIYEDSLENGLSKFLAEYVAKEFLSNAITTLRKGDYI
jgi:hypothetical protein